jgi:hypothetical protein
MTRLIRKLGSRKVPVGIATLIAAVAAPTLVILNPLASSQATSGSTASSAPMSTVPEQLTAALSVFRRPATSADALPPTLQGGLDSLQVGATGAFARRAFVTSNGTAVYLVPSENGVCLVDSSLSEDGCFSIAEVLGAGAAESDDCSSTFPNGNTIEIAGIVPDGAEDPTVVLTDETKRPLKVEGNAYLERFARNAPLPSRIDWNSSSGPVSVSANVPADVATEDCATASELKALEASGKIPRALGHPPAHPTGTTEYNRG